MAENIVESHTAAKHTLAETLKTRRILLSYEPLTGIFSLENQEKRLALARLMMMMMMMIDVTHFDSPCP